MTKFYSGSSNGFYSEDVNDSMPHDSVSITDDRWQELLDGQNDGKLISSGKDGIPVLVDFPEPTKEELATVAATRKGSLMAFATVAIAPLEDAVELDIASETELKILSKWRLYRVLLSRINPTKAPNIEWPIAPV